MPFRGSPSGLSNRLRGAALLRRGWVILVCMGAVALLASAIASSRDRIYTAEGIIVVPSGAREGGPGSANDALTLAATYAGVIPADTVVQRRIAAATGLDRRNVAPNIEVIQDTGTALLRLRYKSQQPDRAEKGARALLAAVTGRRPATRAVARNTTRIVRQPQEPTSSSGLDAGAVPIGLLLGLFLGSVLLVAWERADRRIDDAVALGDELDVPASELKALSTMSVAALVERWERLGEPDGSRVALLPVSKRLRNRAQEAAARLAADAGRHGRVVTVVGGPAHRAGETSGGVVGEHEASGARPLQLVVGGVPGGKDSGEAVALASDLTILIAAPGSKAGRVRRAAAVLRQFGVEPSWALMVRRPRLIERGAKDQAPSDAGERVAEGDIPAGRTA